MTNENLIIDYIHFYYVDKDRPTDDLPNGGVTDISEEVQETYTEYIDEVAKKRLSDKCYDIFQVETDYSEKIRSEIDEMLKRPVPQEATDLEESACAMARRLLFYMRKTGNPKSGVLFQIIYREAGTRKICLLKLAWFDGTYFDYDKKNLSMKKKELLEKLPDRGSFQKGAIYPHPDRFKPEAYMKVYQKDTDANYFDSFLGGLPGISGRDIMKEMKRLAKNISGQPLTYKQNLGLHKGISDHLKNKRKLVKDTDFTRIIQYALPSESKKAIKELVTNDVKMTGIVDGNEIQDLKMSLKVGGIRLFGSYSQFEKHFEEHTGTNRHTIQGRISNIELGSR